MHCCGSASNWESTGMFDIGYNAALWSVFLPEFAVDVIRTIAATHLTDWLTDELTIAIVVSQGSQKLDTSVGKRITLETNVGRMWWLLRTWTVRPWVRPLPHHKDEKCLAGIATHPWPSGLTSIWSICRYLSHSFHLANRFRRYKMWKTCEYWEYVHVFDTFKGHSSIQLSKEMWLS